MPNPMDSKIVNHTRVVVELTTIGFLVTIAAVIIVVVPSSPIVVFEAFSATTIVKTMKQGKVEKGKKETNE